MKSLGWALNAGLLLASGAWLVSDRGWRVDLLANLTAQIGVLWLLTAMVWAAMRWWRHLLALLVAAPLLLLALLPGRAGSDPASGPASVRVLTFNTFNDDTTAAGAATIIDGANADVFTIIEPSVAVAHLLNESETFRARYPYMAPGRTHPSRPTIVSRWPIEPLRLRNGPVEEGRPSPGISPTGAIILRPEGAFVLIAVHPPSPRSAEAWENGNEAIRRLAPMVNDLAQAHGLPIVVGGDFNSTPTGWRSRYLRRQTGLRRAKPWLRPVGTWPSGLRWPARLAIDDVFVSDGVGVVSWEALPGASGGDHSPVMIELRIPFVDPATKPDDQAPQSMPQKSSGLP
jgi:endonuclease/exonuclease/phosphatase (EEP) superfamily protein YafD